MMKVMVTGGSGFLGSHCVVKLLEAGYHVRATVRKASKIEPFEQLMASLVPVAKEMLEVVVADLMSDRDWEPATRGCDFVLHVASPFPGQSPKDETEVLLPARDGTLRVLRAARQANVKRVVLTSSFAAVGYGKGPIEGDVFTESDWTDPALPNAAYIRSKAVAEKAAWDFVEGEGRGMELVVINPVGIFGPLLGPDYSASVGIVKAMLDGHVQGLLDLYFGVVDVRDVAQLHLAAMVSPLASGHRYIATAGGLVSMAEVAHVLKTEMGNSASKVPTRLTASWKVRLAALFNPRAREALPNLGRKRQASNSKAMRDFNWAPRSADQAILATAKSLIDLRLVDVGN